MEDAETPALSDAESAPELPPDLLRRVAQLSLRSHGDDVRRWLRLSLVCKDWQNFLLGARCSHPLSHSMQSQIPSSIA